MATPTANTAVAIAIQATAGAFTAPAQPADLMPVSQLRLQIDGVTIQSDEYTGSPIKSGDTVAGKRVSLSYRVKARPPGGSDVPAANAFLLGRILQAAKLTEVRTIAAIPAAAEALGAGSSTTKAKLGATAAATLGLYKGMPLLLSDKGATFKAQLTAIRSYAANKDADLVETLGAIPAANYQIPKHVAYMRSTSSADPIALSQSVWVGGNRYDLKDCRLTQLRFSAPVSTRDQAAYPEFEVSFDVTIADYVEQASPAIPALGAVPLFKDGEQHLALKEVGGQNFNIDFGVAGEFPPNPNRQDGSDPSQLVSSTASMTMRRQFYSKSAFDTLALADAQSFHPFYAAWGTGSGNLIQVIVPDARFNYQNPDLGGGVAMEDGTLLIDAFDRGIVFAFPYA